MLEFKLVIRHRSFPYSPSWNFATLMQSKAPTFTEEHVLMMLQFRTPFWPLIGTLRWGSRGATSTTIVYSTTLPTKLARVPFVVRMDHTIIRIVHVNAVTIITPPRELQLPRHTCRC